MAKDPVCTMNVEEGRAAATAVYGGIIFYFCSNGCKEAFEKDPAKYVTPTQIGPGRGWSR